MKKGLSYIRLLLVLPLLLSACSQADEADPAPVRKGDVVVNLSISARAATDDKEIGKGNPLNLKVWIYGQKNGNTQEKLAYLEKEATAESKLFTGYDIEGNPVELIREIIENGKEYNQLHFYVVVNDAAATWENPVATLGKTTSIEDIKAATFTGLATNIALQDNQVPMYGEQSVTIAGNYDYQIDIPVVRSVGKLELYFTKSTDAAQLTINSLKLEHVPEKGFLYKDLKAENDERLNGLTYKPEAISLKEEKTTISSSLLDNGQLGNFHLYESNFTQLTLTQPYLLENPNGETWNDSQMPDYIYPDDLLQETTIPTDNQYKLTVNYTLNGDIKNQAIYLPKIERNTLYKIYARVLDKGARMQLTLKVQPWEVKEESWDYTEQVTIAEEGKITWDEGTYSKIDKEKAQVFVQNNTPAQCTFTLTTPVGATWHASLEPIEGDFDAFDFENATKTKGEIDGKTITLSIEPKNPNPNKTSMAKLVIVVKTVDGRTIRVNELLPSGVGNGDVKEYTLVQIAN